MDAHDLSFEQREGLSPLPSQLQRGEVSKELRAKLWTYVHSLVSKQFELMAANAGQWSMILRDVHVERDHLRLDKFRALQVYEALGQMFEREPYQKVYGWLDFVMRHPAVPGDFGAKVGVILTECRSAYRVVDRMIVPLASEEERAAFEKALADASQDKFPGARRHLQNAGSALTNGNFPDSVRESIHAVESVVRVLEPSGEFGKAMAKLESKIAMHPRFEERLLRDLRLHSDEGGIRQALLESGQPAVDEVDAIFFIGACSSFVSYLIGKARLAGLA
jgi:hypothetical protein